MRTLRDKRGFTLIELSVVMVVIAILLAVFAPSVLGELSTQSNQSEEVSLSAAWHAARRIYLMENPSYYPSSTQLAATLSQAAAQAGVFVASDSDPSTSGVINVTTDSDQELVLCARASSGSYLTIRDDGSGQPLFGKGDSCTSGANPASAGIAVTAPAPGPNEVSAADWPF